MPRHDHAASVISNNRVTIVRAPALAALPRVRHGFFTRNEQRAGETLRRSQLRLSHPGGTPTP